MYIGAHNKDECTSENGCHVVTITHAWVKKGFVFIEDGVPDNDVAMAKQGEWEATDSEIDLPRIVNQNLC